MQSSLASSKTESRYEGNFPSAVGEQKVAAKKTKGGLSVLRSADHYNPGDYLSAGILCNCDQICVAVMDAD